MATEDTFDKFIADSDGEKGEPVGADEKGYDPQYRVISGEKIPVSKAHGKLWKSRLSAAQSKLEQDGELDRWNNAIAYYRNDQSQRSDKQVDDSADLGTKLTSTGMETENVVFANVSALVPAVYAKNPVIEISCETEQYKDFDRTCEKLVNTLFGKGKTPRIDLKPKARRAVIMTALANYAYIEIGYTTREQGSEQTLADIQKIAQQLSKEKDKRKIEEMEAQLTALEDKVDLLRPSGPWAKFRRPHDIVRDPDATTLSECRYIYIRDYLDTQFLKVVYGRKNDKDEWESIFKPSHVLKVSGAGGNSAEDETKESFHMFEFNSDKTAKDYGFSDDESFNKAQQTEVWYVWDKATRRVYLYNNSDWSWPLWVWSDPYDLDSFFPVSELEFYTDPCEAYGRSEVLYYLDQQDGINETNNEIAKVRHYVAGKVIYNSNIIKNDEIIDEFIAGTSRKRALGVPLPPDADLTKLFFPFTPQTAHLLNTVIFDKQRLMQSIDRVSSITEVMRGAEYKTNTTNKAIESYQSNTQMRLDEKVDEVEDFIGDIGWKLAQLCVKFMEADMVASLLGDQHAQIWSQKPELAAFQAYSSTAVVGGSALKPTSATKKQQALQIGQILGQFASTTPAAAVVMLKVMERAFDEVVIRSEDWDMIMQSIAQQAQQGAGAEGEGGGGDQLAQVEQLIDKMPPPAKKMLAQLILKGAPIREAVGMVVKELQGAQNGGGGEPQQPQSGATNGG